MALDHDPLASMYTGAPVSKLRDDEQGDSSSAVQTPLLGAMRRTRTKDRAPSQAESPGHEDEGPEADSILDQSAPKEDASEDVPMPEDAN